MAGMDGRPVAEESEGLMGVGTLTWSSEDDGQASNPKGRKREGVKRYAN